MNHVGTDTDINPIKVLPVFPKLFFSVSRIRFPNTWDEFKGTPDTALLIQTVLKTTPFTSFTTDKRFRNTTFFTRKMSVMGSPFSKKYVSLLTAITDVDRYTSNVC